MSLLCLLCKNKLSESVCVDCFSNYFSGNPWRIVLLSSDTVWNTFLAQHNEWKFCAKLDAYKANPHRTSLKFRNSEISCE